MITIHFEDEHYIAVEKKSGTFVHPYKKESNVRESLMAEVRDHLGHYVYPVNRLDRPVSGIVIFSKASEFVRPLQEIWHTDKIRKYYLALTRGIFEKPGEFNFALHDDNKIPKDALTLYSPLLRYQSATLVEVEIKTGRFHQIRRHFSRRVDHLLGDRKYGKKKYNDYYLEHFELNRVFLHAYKLEFTNPLTSQKTQITSALSQDLLHTLKLMQPEYLATIQGIDYIDLPYG